MKHLHIDISFCAYAMANDICGNYSQTNLVDPPQTNTPSRLELVTVGRIVSSPSLG